jgi:hypothetical protein
MRTVAVKADKARPPSHPKPADPAALNEATEALESSVADLKRVRSLDSMLELEWDIRRLKHMTTMAAEWAEEQNFYHRDPTADDDTNRQSADQHDRLVRGRPNRREGRRRLQRLSGVDAQ